MHAFEISAAFEQQQLINDFQHFIIQFILRAWMTFLSIITVHLYLEMNVLLLIFSAWQIQSTDHSISEDSGMFSLTFVII